jgi:PAS domain S-box-containing protein
LPDTFSATEERLQFLLNLEEALRKVPSAEAITALAAELLGQHLQAGRAGFGDVVENGQVIRVEQDWAGTMDSLAGKARVFDALGPAIIALLRNGKMLVVESCDNDPRIEPEHLQAWRSIGTKALIIAPLVRDRQLAGVFYVHSAVPRLWTPAEVTLVRDVAARTWSAYAQFKVEAALRASEDRLRDITDALPILIAYLDKDQVFRFVNKPYEKWFGRPIHQILGHHLSELMAPEVYEARRPYVERALAGEQVQYDIDMPRPDEPVTTQILHVPHRDESGTVQGLYALVQDITARKRNEMALAESENRFRQLAELSPAFIWSADVDGGVTYISQRWHDFLGREQSNPFTADDDALHPDDRIVVGRAWQHSLATGEPLWIQARFRRHDGDFVWHSVRAEPSRNPAGVITGWLGATTDIHASVVHAQERQRDHDRLWNISQELMLVRDGTGTILSVNPTATRLLGWKPADMVGKSVFDFMHPDDQTRTADYVARQSVTDDVIAIQNRYRAADGSYRLFDWRGVTENGVVHAVGRDITAEHQAAQELLSAEEALRQAQKMEAIGQLTGGIAHDFNNMLAGIIGSLDVIQRRIAAGRFDDLARFINGAITSSKRAASLTQRLLAFGRRQALDIRPVEVGQLVSSLHDLLRRTLGEAITIQAIVPPTSCWAQADAAQLESAILNLAINARDAMPSGGDIRLNVQSRTIAADTARLKRGEYIAVTVSDTGSGMPPEVMAKAFDPFFTTKPIGQGTGLGLSMIHGFMGQIGGDVTIDSAPGQGTTVTMFLPQARHADTPQASSPAFQPSKSLASGTVLVVEDDPAVSMLVVSLLDELGLKSVVAVDGNAGLSILQSAIRVDLLISDVGLPGLDGRQLAEHARQVRPFLKVLFLTGYAEGAALRAADLQPGMRLMTKPFEMAALGQMIQDMLSSDPPPLGS